MTSIVMTPTTALQALLQSGWHLPSAAVHRLLGDPAHPPAAAPAAYHCCSSADFAGHHYVSLGQDEQHCTGPGSDAVRSARAHLLYAGLSFVYMLAASGLAGLAQLGSVSRLWMEVRMVQMLWQGDHWSWMMSIHRAAAGAGDQLSAPFGQGSRCSAS